MAETEWFDWGDVADQAGVDRLSVILALRDQWSSTDQWRKPNRSRDVDRLMVEDRSVPGRVQAIIEGLARRGRMDAV